MAKKSKEIAPAEEKPVCFVIMPFGGWFDQYYRDIYRPAIEQSGLHPHRADDLYRPSSIVGDIWAYTNKAKLLLADLTGRNPNVFYELGLAHALARPAILLTESMDDVPFDLRSIRILKYDKNRPDWGGLLQEAIKKAITEVLAAPTDAVPPTFLQVSDEDSVTVSPETKEILELKRGLDLLRMEVRGGGLGVPSALSQEQTVDAVAIMRKVGQSDVDIYTHLVSSGVSPGYASQALKRNSGTPALDQLIEKSKFRSSADPGKS